MKRIYALALSMLILGLAACVKENYNCPSPQSEGLYVGLKFRTGVAFGGRTLNSGEELGEVMEGDRVINSILVYFTQREQTDAEDFVSDWKIKDYIYVDKDNIHDFDRSPEGIIYLPTKVDPGEYQLIVLANPCVLLQNQFSDTFNNVLMMHESEQCLLLQKPGSFIMTNTNRNKESSQYPYTAITVDIKKENTRKNPAFKELTVDRVVAALQVPDTRVLVGDKAETPDFDFEISGFVTINNFRGYNVWQKWRDEQGQEVLCTDCGCDYVKDNYFYDFATYGIISEGKVVGIKQDAAAKFTMTPKFVFENNATKFKDCGNLTASAWCATGVILQVSHPDKKPFYAQKVGDKWIFRTMDATLIPTLRESADLIKFEAGSMYYTVYIQDPSLHYTVDGEEKNYYVVVRNTAYDVAFEALNAPGSKFPGGEQENLDDKDQEITPDQHNQIDVSISVQDWNDGTIDLEI